MFHFLVFSPPWLFRLGDIVFKLRLSVSVALSLALLSVSGTTSATSTTTKLSLNINILSPLRNDHGKLNIKTKNNIPDYLRHSTYLCHKHPYSVKAI